MCDCGNEVDIPTRSLISGKTKSCGCLQREKVSNIGKQTIFQAKQKQMELTDKTNQTFGKLTVLSLEYSDEWASPKQKCQCGNICYVLSSDLSSGNTASCGCLKSKGEEKIATLLKQNNILFEREKVFKDCLSSAKGNYRFDFWVNSSYLIEYDGIQHYKEIPFFQQKLSDRQKSDTDKNEWCKTKGIPLIRIPYSHLEQIVIEDLIPETSKFIIK